MRCTAQAEVISKNSVIEFLTYNEATYAAYWPCIVIETGEDTLLFMCPALAWQDARPWRVHRSRLIFYGALSLRAKALLELPRVLAQGTPRTLDEIALRKPEPLQDFVVCD